MDHVRVISKMLVFMTIHVLLNVLEIQTSQILKLEAEDFAGKNFMYRQAASQAKTASMKENGALFIPFCLRRQTTVSVNSVLYTNDGAQNNIKMFIDNVFIGEWMSHNVSEKGTHWNSVYTVGPIGFPVLLTKGAHKLKIHVSPGSVSFGTRDPFGIEIDVVYLQIEDDGITTNYLRCFNSMCVDTITYSDRHKDRSDIPSGRIVQMSRHSHCLEDSNIKIPIYHESVKQFRISALPPRYRSFWTYSHAQFEGCPEYSNYHWQYMVVECTNTSQVRTYLRSELISKMYQKHKGCQVTISFDLEGMSYGKNEAHIGSFLEIGIQGQSKQNMIISPVYGMAHRKEALYLFNEMESKVLNSTNSLATWYFPDFTWAEMENESTVHINSITIDIPNNAVLDFIRLKRRNEHLPEMTQIYQTEHFIIQKSEFDFWWRDPAIRTGEEEDMKVYIATEDGEEYKGTADYIVFVRNRIWATNGEMDHTFVLYQDGSARILPIVPHGLDTYVPFGNDIVIGQSDPSHMRPHAPIKKLVLRPKNDTIDIYYNDGNFAKVRVVSNMKETNVTVTDINFTKDKMTNPFAIFRSTWVEDGRAKVDHVTINGLPAEHILENSWTTRYGTNFIFFRKCISSYNSQSPDYSVEILSDMEVG